MAALKIEVTTTMGDLLLEWPKGGCSHALNRWLFNGGWTVLSCCCGGLTMAIMVFNSGFANAMMSLWYCKNSKLSSRVFL